MKESLMFLYSQIIEQHHHIIKTKLCYQLCYLRDILHYYPISGKLLCLSFLFKCLNCLLDLVYDAATKKIK